jgi:glutamate synthase domain-containing protein 3
MPRCAPPELPVNEVRDYHLINSQVAHWLDEGHGLIRLTGVGGQRLLLAGLRGAWRARIEVLGLAGPELAAELDAPGLIIVSRGGARDGVGRSLRAGTVVLRDAADECVGYRQTGGLVVALGSVGARAGLELRGGVLVLGGPAGHLVGERQRGGRIVALGRPLGPMAGHGRTSGRLHLELAGLPGGLTRLAVEALREAYREV